MEENLDKIEKWPKEEYKEKPSIVEDKEAVLEKKELTEEETDEICEKCKSPMVKKLGRFGKFLACSNYPDCRNTKPLDENGKPEEPEKIDKKCDKCGKPMIVKNGRYGKFIACSGYPDCKNIVNIEDKTGVKCPQCNEGDIVAKRSRKGKVFFACNKYPDCKFALWSKPTGDKCPDCDSLLVYGAKDTARCSNKECKYQK